jgi:hypothetical protein
MTGPSRDEMLPPGDIAEQRKATSDNEIELASPHTNNYWPVGLSLVTSERLEDGKRCFADSAKESRNLASGLRLK